VRASQSTKYPPTSATIAAPDDAWACRCVGRGYYTPEIHRRASKNSKLVSFIIRILIHLYSRLMFLFTQSYSTTVLLNLEYSYPVKCGSSSLESRAAVPMVQLYEVLCERMGISTRRVRFTPILSDNDLAYGSG
jgi:hypothetical protein